MIVVEIFGSGVMIHLVMDIYLKKHHTDMMKVYQVID